MRGLRLLFLGVLAGYIAAGILLAEFSVRMPRLPLTNPSEYRSRYEHDFRAHVEDVSMNAADGAVLKAWFVTPPNTNGRSIVLLHGVGDNRIGMSGFADIFLQRGYAVLLPDSREHGESGGQIATYGVLERDDVRRWVDWMGGREPGCTYLLGESMGAAIGLQAAAVTPKLCAVAVEDPYATFREIAYERMGRQTHLGTFFWKTIGRPVIEVAIVWSRLRYGVNLAQAEPKTAVELSHTPSLLIAGTLDDQIPMHHAQELETVCESHCTLWVVTGADHGGASDVAPQEFARRVTQWFQMHDTR